MGKGVAYPRFVATSRNKGEVVKKLTIEDYTVAAKRLGCQVAAVRAVAEVEAPRGGFNPDWTPVTLFEGHIFRKYTHGRYDESHPHLSYAKWTRKWYGKGWEAEQKRIQEALTLDREAALMSASWGKFQIMGFNFALCGYTTLQRFVNGMYLSEASQLNAFVEYIIATGLNDELVECRFEDFARYYNGPLYYKNKYGTKMLNSFIKFGGEL